MKILKQVIISCCLLFVSFFIFSACHRFQSHAIQAEPAPYHVLECDHSDSVLGADHQTEYTFWLEGNYSEIKANEKITITLNGKEVSGKYKHSQNQMPNNYSSRFYENANGTLFAVDPSGTPVFYFWGKQDTDNKSANSCTEQQCVSVAKSFLGQYVNIEDYQITVVNKNAKNIYEITFTKYLNGYETTDQATVSVYGNGTLYSYSSFMLGKIPETAALPFEYDAAVYSVERKLDTIYNDIREDYSSIIYDTPNFKYTILEDGSTALYCIVDVHFEKEIEESKMLVQSEKVALLVELG